MSLLPDEYTRRARLSPAILAVIPAAPAFAAAAHWLGLALPTELSWTSISGSSVLLTSVAFWMLAAQVGRAGRRRQPRLFASWGGPPLVAAMRHRDGNAEAVPWGRIRTMLAERTGTAQPTVDDEAADPAAADQVYHDYQAELRSLTRDAVQFRHVFEENCNYGFRRNLWALKPIGETIAALAIGLGLGLLCATGFEFAKVPDAVAAIVMGAIAIYAWSFAKADWVREAADAYVAAMLDAGLRLAREKERAA